MACSSIQQLTFQPSLFQVSPAGTDGFRREQSFLAGAGNDWKVPVQGVQVQLQFSELMAAIKEPR